MKAKRILLGLTGAALGLLIVSGQLTPPTEAAPPPGPHGAPEPDMLGVHWAKGNAPIFGSSDPHLLWHGGPVMSSGTVVKPIYWGTTWNSTASQTKMANLGTFYGSVGGSSYMNTNKGNDTASTPAVSSSVSYAGAVVDPTAGPTRAPRTSDVLAEVQRQVNAGQIVPVANGYYPVYVDAKRGGAGYCAWHSWGNVSYGGTTVLVQFGFFFNLDGDSGCDPSDPANTFPQGVEALANVSGHELSEVATDPHGNAWYDRSGYENADKCAWTFDGYVSFGGYNWKIQSNWSNAAYDTNIGATKKGCVNGN